MFLPFKTRKVYKIVWKFTGYQVCLITTVSYKMLLILSPLSYKMYWFFGHLLSGFSIRILVAGERCNFTEEYCERGSMSK